MIRFMTKKYVHFKYVLTLLVVLLLVFCHADAVYAADGRVTFGSDGYEWEVGEEAPIGVYVEGDVPFIGYELYLQYDPAALMYVGGATSYEKNGMLYITETGNESVYKTMLHFVPQRAGSTSIKVVAVNCAVGGENVDGVASEVLNMTSLSQAEIVIKDKNSSRLASLSISPEGVRSFSPDKLEYELTVPAETEKLNVRYTTEAGAAEVTVSDTGLEPGENVITITVHGASDTTVYTLRVMREQEEQASQEDTRETETEKESVEDKTLIESETSAEEESMERESMEKDSMEEGSAEEPLEEEASMMSETLMTETEDAEIAAMNVFGSTGTFGETEPSTGEEQAESGEKEQTSASVILWIMAGAVVLLIAGYIEYFIITRPRSKGGNESELLAEGDLKDVTPGQKVIELKNVTMKFRMASDESSSLKEYMIRLLKHQLKYRHFTALDDISFEVMQGEVIGIIGTNGSGKSTLLKIISGALNPTSGTVNVDRRKVQMLTLGTGFDAELTARENVYLNGAIIGYTKEYIDEKYDDIVSFAELEGFMEERMKNFSSGMVSRLGFAIATMRDAPDILILDEVLSVGDMFFRKKSEQRIKEMIHSGATVLIVSHSMDTIMKNCDRVVWIEKGKMRMVGKAKEVCEAYKKMEQSKTDN